MYTFLDFSLHLNQTNVELDNEDVDLERIRSLYDENQSMWVL